jgi:glutaminase
MKKTIAVINDIYKELKGQWNGKVADYIPELAKINPNSFGISICSTKGEIFNWGDTSNHFCLQSCSKPLSYCIAYDHLGKEELHKRVGYEPSGETFNAFILNKEGLPHNPMINSGAIMVCSQIGKKFEPSKRFNIIKKFYSDLAGEKEIGFDNSVFLSEQQNADRNISLAYYMRENNAFKEYISPNEISETLNLYFQQCSSTMNTKMGAIISSTLANGGLCPTTNKQVCTTDATSDCLSLMFSCGMYNYSGQFAFEVGLPAKSGVSGCILLVIPNVMGICIWSPPLDSQGNSDLGIKFCTKLNEKLNLHLFKNIIKNKIDLMDSLSIRFLQLCCDGKIEEVKNIISSINVNICDYDKRTPLHLAVSKGHVELVALLLKHNALYCQDRWGNYPIDEIKNKQGNNYDEIKTLLYNQ